ncbi:MAG TPA: hypothetical protein DIU39_07645 [Flavobacteriales bacterium]|nr:hypothetical protein [Flavobacteriales bacterium]|tara:strand:- start:9392 stop:9733 length:342 start_codon:yes stop_codon:yes gene_type:complete
MVEPKKRLLISYEKLPKEVVDVFRSKYPQGIDDVDDDDILTVNSPKGETFQAVRLEMDNAIYLIKVKTIEKSFVAIDDDEDDDLDDEITKTIPVKIDEDIETEDDDDDDNDDI